MLAPRDLRLPHDTWRPGQRLAIRTARSLPTQHLVLQAPTGSGKTAIALGLSQLTNRRVAILTSSKGLQAQYLDSVDWLTDIRGMSNYPCLAARDEHARLFAFKSARDITCDEGPCRAELPCTLKDDGCLYFDAYRRALASRVVLTNYDYWISSRRFSKGLGPVDYLVCDEAHDAPAKLMDACQVELSLHEVDLKRYPRTLANWKSWAAGRLDEVRRGDQDGDARVRKRRLIETLEGILRCDQHWAFEQQDTRVVFAPTVPRHLTRLLFDATTKVIFMSATITAEALSTVLNLGDTNVTYLGLQSRFPLARRPVYLVQTCRVDHRMSRDDHAFWLQQIDRVIETRTDRKGIIHTVSYARQQEILTHSKFSGMMLAPRRASELAEAVERFKSSSRPAILISPSITTGFDFPGDTCRYNLIVKVPFPDTRSPIMKARLKATPSYREVLTMQTLVQAVGRGTRSADDWCESLILDDNAGWFLFHNSAFAPDWFMDSVIRTRRVPPPLRVT